MVRQLVACVLVAASCGRSRGVPDHDLRGRVETKDRGPHQVEVDRAAKDPEALSIALALPHHVVTAALGMHSVAIASAVHVSENGKATTELEDKTLIQVGEKGAFYALYTNSADYGREAVFVGGKLYLRPRYQRWHERAPEAPEEPEQLEDQFAEPVAATWDLFAPGTELSDRGAVQVAGRAGRKIEIKLASAQRKPASEPLAQRKWRETRTIEHMTGEVVLDAEKGVPLSVKLAGTVSFLRDGRRFAMQVSVQSDISDLGKGAEIAVPATEDVVATPERLREVADRDFLLQGIAPPLRKKTDGTAVAPQPRGGTGSGNAGTPKVETK
ncbi:hypothetical protein BH11MYX1_BH11MYX1_57990 [soil metagenome]